MALTVAIEIGTRQIRAVLLDPGDSPDGLPPIQRVVAKEIDVGGISVDPDLAQVVADIASEVSQDRQAAVRAVAVACSAAVDLHGYISPHGPKVIDSGDQKQPHLYRFRRPLSAKLKPIFKPDTLLGIGNRSDMAAIGEHKFGHSAPEMVFVSVGGVVGTGIITRNQLVVGHNGFAGQYGHVLAAPDAPTKCSVCGQSGCLSSVVGGTAVLAQLDGRRTEPGAKQLIEHLVRNATPPHEDVGQKLELNGAKIDARALVRAGGIEDPRTGKLRFPLANDIMMSTVRPLGTAIAQLVSLLDPRYVVVGGIMVDAEYLDVHITDAVRGHLPAFRKDINLIRRSAFSALDEFADLSGDEAALYGSACWMWDYPHTSLGH
jgi:predicted NBD/HSP70 family sugar kinase